MRRLALVTLLLAACASAPRDAGPDRQRAIYENVTIEQVRQAAVEALNDLSRFMEPARVTEDGRVLADYGATGRTTIEVRFTELDAAVAAEVDVDANRSCSATTERVHNPPPRQRAGAVAIRSENGKVIEYSGGVTAPEASSARGPTCSSEGEGRSGRREGWVLDRIGELLREG